MMEQILSSSTAPAAFGLALLCAGQLSTFTGTISGRDPLPPPLPGSTSADWRTGTDRRAFRYVQLLMDPITAICCHRAHTLFWIWFIDSDIHTDGARSHLLALQARWCCKAF